MSIQLFQGDCLEVMKSIPDGSVDLILTDPPYGTTACKWDSVIPLDAMWVELKRVIKPNGAIVLFGSEPFSSALRMSNIEQYKYDWQWLKNRPTGHLNAKHRPLKFIEYIHVFSNGEARSKGNNMSYNPQGLVEVNRKVTERKRIENDNHKYIRESRQGKSYEQKYTNYPNSLLKFDRPNKTVHPTQKPVALMEYLIKTYTHEGDTVLDFTMGSGSTGVACVNTNRKFIGIELDENYFGIAQGRINPPTIDFELEQLDIFGEQA